MVLSFFFLIRIGYSYLFGGEKDLLASDAGSYNGYALAILKNSEWVTNPDFLGHYRSPVYPLFLSAIYFIFGIENFSAVFFFQALLNTLTVYYIYKLSASIFGEKESSLALVWSGLYFIYFYYIGIIYREILIYLLVIFSFYQLWLFFNRNNRADFLKNINLWQFLIAFVILLHTDSRFLGYIPFMALLFIVFGDFRTGIKQYFIMLGVIILLLIPWSIRNYLAYGNFVLLNTRTLDLSRKEMSTRFELLNMKDQNAPAKEAGEHGGINENYPTEEERNLIKKGINPNNRPDYEIELIKNDKYPATSFWGRKLYYSARMWIPFKFGWDYHPFPDARLNKPWSLKHNLITIFCYGILLPFVLIGSFYLLMRKEKLVCFLTFPILSHFFIHFFMFGHERYRVQIDSFIIILGCYGLLLMIKTIKQKIV